MSVQNEPDIENPEYDTCRWTAQQIHDFIPYLSSGLRAAGFAGIKIAIPEVAGWTFQRLGLAMSDPVVAEKVGLILGHAYEAKTPLASLPRTAFTFGRQRSATPTGTMAA